MRKRRKYHQTRIWIVTIAALLILVCSSGLFVVMSAGLWPAGFGGLENDSVSKRLWPNWKDVLSSGIPGMSEISMPQPVIIKNDSKSQNTLRNVVIFLSNIDIDDAKTWFRLEIPLLATVKHGQPAISATTMPNFPKFDSKSMLSAGKPLVGIYHTHTAESFVPSSGVTHRPGGQRGEIVEVGEALAKRLDMRGIKAVQSKTIHDYPSFMKAYGPSESTAKAILTDNPSIQMIFDIHRDADKRENSVMTIAGVAVARITIVVAKGQQDLIQPYWQQNHAFAKLIDARINQHFPGLSRGIQLVEWRYNQHLHPRALLLEVGCQENSKEEAMYSIELLGDVISEIITENKN